MANILTRQHAELIADKLEAERVEGRKKSGGGREHTLAIIYHEGVQIASFGIRHGSNKELPHGHIVSDLHVTPNQGRKLAICEWQKHDWIELMRISGRLPQTELPATEIKRPIIPRHGKRSRKKGDS